MAERMFTAAKALFTSNTQSQQYTDIQNDLGLEVIGGKIVCNSPFPVFPLKFIFQLIPSKVDFETIVQGKRYNSGSSPINVWFFEDWFEIPPDAEKILVSIAGIDSSGAVIIIGETITSVSQSKDVVKDIPLTFKRDLGGEWSFLHSSNGFVSLRTRNASILRSLKGSSRNSMGIQSHIDLNSRKPMGSLRISVWQGKQINSSCACYVTLSTLANRVSDKHRSQSLQNPHNPVFDYVTKLPIFRLQEDLLLELWEEGPIKDVQLGQLIIPLSWLVERGALGGMMANDATLPSEVDGSKMSLSSWFEVFPVNVPTPFNRWGQYRPVKEGIPLTAGYGIAKKPVGFLKVDLVLQLSPDWSGRLLANPYLYGASESTYSNDEDYFYSAVHVAGFTMIDIIRLLSNNILVNKIFDILNWKTHPLLSLAVFYGSCYTALLAQPWQYPFMALAFAAAVGIATGRERSLDNVEIFSEDVKKKENAADSKWLTWRDVQALALTTEKDVRNMKSRMTKLNNLLTFADPALSSVVFLFFLCGACFMASVLCVFSPNQTFFFMIISIFTPAEIQDYIIDSLMANANSAQRAVVKLLDYLQRLATRQAAAVPAPVSRSPSVAEPPPEKVMLWSDWFKKQASMWLDMFPDDEELEHRKICSLAVITKAEEVKRLPVKRQTTYGLSSLRGDLHATSILGKSMPGVVQEQERGEARDNDDRSLAVAMINRGFLGDSGSLMFKLEVMVVSARELDVEESMVQKLKIGHLAAMRSKIYVNLSIKPKFCCHVKYRTGGQLRSPNPQFREPFIFPDVGGEAISLDVDVTIKNALQAKLFETHLGSVSVPLNDLVTDGNLSFFEYHQAWYHLVSPSGEACGAVQLSMSLTVEQR